MLKFLRKLKKRRIYLLSAKEEATSFGRIIEKIPVGAKKFCEFPYWDRSQIKDNKTTVGKLFSSSENEFVDLKLVKA